MKKILIILLLLYPSFVLASWNGNPYIELRYSLLSNKPILNGKSECPCIGSEIIMGYEFNPFRKENWKFNLSNSLLYQTRWDDPEGLRFEWNSDYGIKKRYHFLIGSTSWFNLDRTTSIPYNYYIDYKGVHEDILDRGWSGQHYLWTGFRIDLR